MSTAPSNIGKSFNRGGLEMVNCVAARDHLIRLRYHGCSNKMLCYSLGMPNQRLFDILHRGDSGLIEQFTADGILKLTADGVRERSGLSANGCGGGSAASARGAVSFGAGRLFRLRMGRCACARGGPTPSGPTTARLGEQGIC